MREPDEETHIIGTFDQEAVECALELLKAQEPRLMTLEEVLAYDYKEGALWLETVDTRIICGFSYFYKNYEQFSLPITQIHYLLKRDSWHKPEEYNKTWRCWTSRPTDEQRKEAEWE